MIVVGRRSALLLLAGDIAVFAFSLYLALCLRYREFATSGVLMPYLVPFVVLCALWVFVYYAAGLYSKRLILFPSRVLDTLIGAQIVNIALAAVFFFLVPIFGIAPKTILVIYFIISLVCVYMWRLALYPRLPLSRVRERMALLATSQEAEELAHEVNSNVRYGIEFCYRATAEALTAPRRLGEELQRARVATLVVDTSMPEAAQIMPLVYNLTRTTRTYQFVAFEDLYEEVFDRIPLSELGHAWFLEHVSAADSTLYIVLKRTIDIVGGLLMLVVTAGITPLVFLAERFEGRGPVFIAQERLGRYGAHVHAYKFRSMEKNVAASGEWTNEGTNRITRVGSFLRKTSLDEFPQAINVLRGELSLVGPRNDILGLGTRLSEELSYYDARYLVKPGITGWAQINQQYEPGNVSPQSIEETKVRLAYDFYYLKHRSLGLDLIIALKTVKRMFFRVSSL